MKRWNGWGDEATTYPLPDPAARYLAERVGEGLRLQDATLAETLQAVPPARLPPHPLISSDPEERLRHARGQSLPDWIALRSGQIRVFPDGVAYPASDEEVRSLLEYARKTGAKLIPYGGGTSVVGHINPLPGAAPVLTMNLTRLKRLLRLDDSSHLATFEVTPWGISPNPLNFPRWAAGSSPVPAGSNPTTTDASKPCSREGALKRPPAQWTCPATRPRRPGRT